MGELTTLKDRIAKMTNNIDTLTTLVHNVTLEEKAKKEESLHAGSKRKKTEDADPDTSTCDMEVDAVTSADVYPLTDNSDMSNITFTPSNIFPSGPLLRSTSETPSLSSSSSSASLIPSMSESRYFFLMALDPCRSSTSPSRRASAVLPLFMAAGVTCAGVSLPGYCGPLSPLSTLSLPC